MTKSNNSLISIILIFGIFQILPVFYEQVKNNKNTNNFQFVTIEALDTKNDSSKAGLIENQLMIRVTRAGKIFFIAENQVRQEIIYHSRDFDIQLPNQLDLEYAKSLSSKELLEYLSDPNILPQAFVGTYMTRITNHLSAPNTELRIFTVGEPGIHAFNPKTGNDVFFAQNCKLKFHRRIRSKAFYYVTNSCNNQS